MPARYEPTLSDPVQQVRSREQSLNSRAIRQCPPPVGKSRHDVQMESRDSGRVLVVTDRQDPKAVERLLRSLPDWFGLEPSLLAYVEDARTKPTYLAVDQTLNDVVGALLATTHNRESAEIHLMAVSPERHRQGIGRALVAAFESDMSTAGVRLLQVKTMGPSQPDEAYSRTLRFYRAMGFIPLEELHGLWAENPCLILVKPL